MKQIGFAVNDTNKTSLSQAVRTENAKEETKQKQVDQKCKYFSVIKFLNNKEWDRHTYGHTVIGTIICGH